MSDGSQRVGIHHDLLRVAIEASDFDLVGEAEAFCRARLAEFAEANGMTVDEATLRINQFYRRWDPEFEWMDAEGNVQKGDFFPASQSDYTDLRLTATAYAYPWKKATP